MTFTHDWQLDWIISHGKTLETLTLDDCPIIHEAVLSLCDSERYKHVEETETLRSESSHWAYASRWHDYFRRLRSGLPRLQRFGVGSGPWNSSFDDDRVTAPFEAASSLPAKLAGNRYAVFHQETNPFPWIEPRIWGIGKYEKIKVFGDQYDCCWDAEYDPAPLPKYPDCWDEDQDTLDEYVEVVEDRRSKSRTMDGGMLIT